MIITCKCGIQFRVNKKEIPKEGRKVQCGVCNEIWFQTLITNTDNISKLSVTHYFANFFLLCLILVSFIGVMETFREDLIYSLPSLNTYYQLIDNKINEALMYIENLIRILGIRY